MERETCDVCTLPRVVPSLGQAGVCTDTPTALPPQGLGALGRGFARPPRITLPIPPILRRVHSMASQVRPPTPHPHLVPSVPHTMTPPPMPQLLARSSLSCELGLSLDRQLQSEQFHPEKPMALDPSSSHLQNRVRGQGRWGAAHPRAELQGHWGPCSALSLCPVLRSPCFRRGGPGSFSPTLGASFLPPFSPTR